MIRIDEIYNHTFWPYIKSNVPKTRLFYCDPPGSTAPDALSNFGSWTSDVNYIYCHDQEPIHLDIHSQLFTELGTRTRDLNYNTGARHSAIITSEFNSEFVDAVCTDRGWKSFYYFFHGWAALDWYRGYNHSFLIVPWQKRKIQKTFASPNRIIGGKRQHRVLMLYHFAKKGLLNNWISFPKICPVEQMSVGNIAEHYSDIYPDMLRTVESVKLPRLFPNESESRMSSCWLDQFEMFAESLIYHVSETVYSGRRSHLTEKTFKPIALGMPFVLSATAGSLSYLRSYGFQTFGSVWDESYDLETNDVVRAQMITDVLCKIESMSVAEKQQLFEQCWPIIEHNWNHFYHGEFESVLWKELTSMLENIQREFND